MTFRCQSLSPANHPQHFGQAPATSLRSCAAIRKRACTISRGTRCMRATGIRTAQFCPACRDAPWHLHWNTSAMAPNRRRWWKLPSQWTTLSASHLSIPAMVRSGKAWEKDYSQKMLFSDLRCGQSMPASPSWANFQLKAFFPVRSARRNTRSPKLRSRRCLRIRLASPNPCARTACRPASSRVTVLARLPPHGRPVH